MSACAVSPYIKWIPLELIGQSALLPWCDKMDILWSVLSNAFSNSATTLNGYETVIASHSQNIISLHSYQICIANLFADQKYNWGRIKVWFYVSQLVYKSVAVHERDEFHETVCQWFCVFETKCPDCCAQLQDMRNIWEQFCHHWNRNTVKSWFSI